MLCGVSQFRLVLRSGGKGLQEDGWDFLKVRCGMWSFRHSSGWLKRIHCGGKDFEKSVLDFRRDRRLSRPAGEPQPIALDSLLPPGALVSRLA